MFAAATSCRLQLCHLPILLLGGTLLGLGLPINDTIVVILVDHDD